MATIKSYTGLQQSRKLAEFLPLESADMHYIDNHYDPLMLHLRFCNDLYEEYKSDKWDYIPCWSLAALLGVLPDGTDIVKDKTDTENEKYMCTVGVKDDIISTFGNNPVDACVTMIEKLHELNLL